MFQSARLKLTAWYLLIIMTVSILFSVFIYKSITEELSRVERIQRFRFEHPEYRIMNAQPPPPPVEDEQLLNETKGRVELTLLLVNLFILFGAGLAGYFLAGKTLGPIEEMVEEQNRFVADASHEFRTPLTSLRTAIEVDLRNKKLTSEDAKKVLKGNLEDVKNLQSLSDGLLQLSQYDEKTQFSLKETSLREVLQASMKAVERIAKQKNIKIVLDSKNFRVQGDVRSLTDLFTIFLDNAIKYSKIKGKVMIRTKKTDGKVRVEIQDFGVGIEKKELPHLFDRFYRVDKSRTRTDSSGYGLGLSIAKRIVILHGGEVAVTSTLNEGTTFIISLAAA